MCLGARMVRFIVIDFGDTWLNFQQKLSYVLEEGIRKGRGMDG